MLRDGKIGFIDFGIVGRISPVTWKAIESLVVAMTSEDYQTMAKALATMGATDESVNIDAFAKDLRALFDELKELDPELVVQRENSGAHGFPLLGVPAVFSALHCLHIVLAFSCGGFIHWMRSIRKQKPTISRIPQICAQLLGAMGACWCPNAHQCLNSCENPCRLGNY